ncbi:MAG TPA: family 20 glycosylhydrolase [Puia sp.]|jgi:hypothetical protein
MQYKLRISIVLPYCLVMAVCLFRGTVSVAGVSAGGVSPVGVSAAEVYAAGLPLLPLPRHASTGKTILAFRPGAGVDWRGLDNVAKARLQWHWQRLGGGNDGQSLQAGILGADSSFDDLVARAAPSWKDSIGDQGYILVLHENVRFIAAKTEAGLFYGLQSLRQLIRAKWDREILVADWPSFPFRMVYDDISRGPISTVSYIKQQIERMAELKLNGLSFYIEHVVQPRSHPDFAPENGKLTIPQIKELAAYAGKFYMQLTGSFQSFGHFEKILSLPQYASMGATSTLISPVNDKARKFLAEVIGELCDAFSGPYFNVNCDETFDLGQGTTKPYVEKLGAAAFYASHLRFLDSIVKSHGKKMMMWGDFALEHKEVLDMLPPDITYLTWEYGDQPSYDKWIKPFASRRLPFMVCPGVLNTYRMFPDMAMARANITGFTREGRQRGAEGVITTIWDDGGAYLFSGDWYGVYVTAECSWSGGAEDRIQPTGDEATGPDNTFSFDRRYAFTAYGDAEDNYVKALFTLMKLKDLPLTYDLSDRLWHQRLLPDSGKTLIVNNRSADAALTVAEESAGYLLKCRPRWNEADIRTLSFAIDQYKLMITSRLRIAAAAGGYRRAARLASGGEHGQAARMLAAYTDTIEGLKRSYKLLGNRFARAWQAENQPYWLDSVLKPYSEKAAALARVARGLRRAREKAVAHQSLPPAAVVSLDIREEPFYYFQNWMLAGPFPAGDGTEATADAQHLYSDNAAYNKPPSPGDFTMQRNKLYRWRKFFSDDGGIIDLGKEYGGEAGAIVYAYCQISSDTAADIRVRAASSATMEIFCNGKAVRDRQDDNGESTIRLKLKAGVNPVLLRLHKDNKEDWSFSFRLQDQLTVTNHKYKYQLNGKNKLYAAD